MSEIFNANRDYESPEQRLHLCPYDLGLGAKKADRSSATG
jgi:hypothetical protein